MKALPTLFAAIAIALNVQATTYRIGYPGNAVTGVDFQTANISTAIQNALNGDTIQLYQQFWTVNSLSINVTKQLHFIGFGYMLNMNDSLQAVSSMDAHPINITFNTGSEGSTVSGVYCSSLYVNSNNVKIMRCRINNYLYLNNTTANLSNVDILQCFINYVDEYSSYGFTNVNMRNNWMYSANLNSSSGYYFNNVCRYDLILGNFVARNNIIGTPYTTDFNPLASTFIHNLFALDTFYVSGSQNLFDVDMNSVFALWNNGSVYADTQLVLKVNSPAINAGINNAGGQTNAGIFGGEPGQAYRLSGIPAVPSIYYISTPAQVPNTGTFDVHFGVRPNN